MDISDFVYLFHVMIMNKFVLRDLVVFVIIIVPLRTTNVVCRLSFVKIHFFIFIRKIWDVQFPSWDSPTDAN